MTPTETLRSALSHVDKDRCVTGEIVNNTIVLNYVTTIYKDKHSDPTLGRDRESETNILTIAIDSEVPLDVQIEEALQEMEREPIRYE